MCDVSRIDNGSFVSSKGFLCEQTFIGCFFASLFLFFGYEDGDRTVYDLLSFDV